MGDSLAAQVNSRNAVLVERLQRELRRLQELVSDLLELSRLENALPGQGMRAQPLGLAALVEQVRVRRQMPWAAANYYTAPGGVVQSGYAVAGMYRQLWDLLTGDPAQPLAPTVVGSYPGHGALDVQLDPAHDGWTQHRWLHVFFSTSMDAASLEQPGAICLFDPDGRRVGGVVEPGSWSRDYAHAVKFRLAEALKPNARYTAVVTPKVKDYRGLALERPYSFSFTTARSGAQ